MGEVAGLTLTVLRIYCQHPRPQPSESPQRDNTVYLPLMHKNLGAVSVAHSVRSDCFNY